MSLCPTCPACRKGARGALCRYHETKLRSYGPNAEAKIIESWADDVFDEMLTDMHNKLVSKIAHEHEGTLYVTFRSLGFHAFNSEEWIEVELAPDAKFTRIASGPPGGPIHNLNPAY